MKTHFNKGHRMATTNIPAFIPLSDHTAYVLQTTQETVGPLASWEPAELRVLKKIPWFATFCVLNLLFPLAHNGTCIGLVMGLWLYTTVMKKLAERERQKIHDRIRRGLLEANTSDYLRAQEAEEQLQILHRLSPSLLSTSEPSYDEELVPLCYEPRLARWVLDKLKPYFTKENCPLDCIFDDDTPLLLEHCALLYLAGPQIELLRVLIPLRSASEALFESIREEYADTTHVGTAISHFTLPDAIIDGVSHTEELIAASCQKPPRERPSIGIRGVTIKEAPQRQRVVLATALNIDGKEVVLLPTNFFEELHKTLGALSRYNETPDTVTTP